MQEVQPLIQILEIDHNVFFGNGNSNDPLYGNSGGLYVPGAGYTYSNTTKQDPLFISATDFHLQSGSPAIAIGVDVGLTTDYAGLTWLNPPSIGAYEYTTSLTLPSLTTTVVTNITSTTASSGGNITSDGGAAVTARGVCFHTTVNPTIARRKITGGSGTGVFTSAIVGLTADSVSIMSGLMLLTALGRLTVHRGLLQLLQLRFHRDNLLIHAGKFILAPNSTINLSKAMKRMKLLSLLFLITFTVVYCQPDKEFTKPIKVVSITFPDGSILSSAIPVGTTVTWSTLAGKPATYPPTAHTHDYNTEITNKPEVISLDTAISQLSGIKLPVLNTTQINALTPVAGTLVYDNTLNVLKVYSGSVWKIIITSN